jgi:hypothetical protein
MVTGTWNLGGASPFLSERARTRAPQVLLYAAVAGAAMLISPAGAVVLFSGEAPEIDIARVARSAAALSGHDSISFRVGATCVHAAPVCLGWVLCVLSTAGVQPSLVIDRLRRASHVLALALTDGVRPGGSSGSGGGSAPNEVFAERLSERKG